MALYLKVVLVGDSDVGKTSIGYLMSHPLTTGTVPYTESTVGASYFRTKFDSPGGRISADIWDTAGQERYHSLVPLYLRNANVVLYVYDHRPETLVSIMDKWEPFVRANLHRPHVSILIRNKSDVDCRQYSDSDYAASRGFRKIQTTCLNGSAGKTVIAEIVNSYYRSPSPGVWEEVASAPIPHLSQEPIPQQSEAPTTQPGCFC